MYFLNIEKKTFGIFMDPSGMFVSTALNGSVLVAVCLCRQPDIPP